MVKWAGGQSTEHSGFMCWWPASPSTPAAESCVLICTCWHLVFCKPVPNSSGSHGICRWQLGAGPRVCNDVICCNVGTELLLLATQLFNSGHFWLYSMCSFPCIWLKVKKQIIRWGQTTSDLSLLQTLPFRYFCSLCFCDSAIESPSLFLLTDCSCKAKASALSASVLKVQIYTYCLGEILSDLILTYSM